MFTREVLGIQRSASSGPAGDALPRPAAERNHRSGFRADIEGLRAVAVLLVVVSHAGVSGVAGGYVGVDVFFVISGFLITSLLVREVMTTGRIDVGRFYARRAVRLLPLSTLVLMVTLLLSWSSLNPARMGQYAVDALAGAGYLMNVRLAIAGTDYFATNAPSPFQHFWSLATEEQFYLFWPLLIAITVTVLHGRGVSWPRRHVLIAVLGTVTAASLCWSVVELDHSAPWAYFGLPSRAWELGVGALVALAAARLTRLPGRVAAVLGTFGLVAVVGSALCYDETTAFPGLAALVPVLGAASVIAAGAGDPSRGVGRVLVLPPLQTVGRLSYGWYLWHWPVLVIAPVALGTSVPVPARLGLCAAALALAFVTYQLVENPVRYRRALTARPWRGLGVGASLSALSAVAALVAATIPINLEVGEPGVDTAAAVAVAGNPQAELTALIRQAGRVAKVPSNLTPSLTTVAADAPAPQRDGCHADFAVTAPTGPCVYGHPDSPTTVVLFGDSHALQWFPAIERVALERNWRLLALTKSSCSPAAIAVTNVRLRRAYRECGSWRAAALRRIREAAPQIVIVATSTSYDSVLLNAPSDPDAVWRAGLASTLDTLTTSARSTVVLGDTPYLGRDPVDCLGLSEWISQCSDPRGGVLPDERWRAILAQEARRVDALFIDPLPWLCTSVCPQVVGNIMVYRDNNHLSTAYVGMLAPLIEARLGQGGSLG